MSLATKTSTVVWIHAASRLQARVTYNCADTRSLAMVIESSSQRAREHALACADGLMPNGEARYLAVERAFDTALSDSLFFRRPHATQRALRRAVFTAIADDGGFSYLHAATELRAARVSGADVLLAHVKHTGKRAEDVRRDWENALRGRGGTYVGWYAGVRVMNWFFSDEACVVHDLYTPKPSNMLGSVCDALDFALTRKACHPDSSVSIRTTDGSTYTARTVQEPPPHELQ